jgi:glycosyltransferase involved in cell wall biosynthesis
VQEIQHKSPHLLILGPLDFPGTTASSLRVSAYGRAIIESGGKVTVLSYRPCHSSADISATGAVNGIRYNYTSGRTVQPKILWKKLFYELVGLVNAFRLIYKINKSEPIDALLFYAFDTLAGGLFSFWMHRMKIPILEEKCEFQFKDRKRFFKAIRAWIYEKWVVPSFDGMIIMTDALERYYRPLMKKHAIVLRMPILVDMSRFEKVSTTSKEKYIAYCGSPSGDKDGVPILIESFAKIAPLYPDMRLVIVGDYASQPEKEKMLKKIRNLGVADKVEITGRKTPDKVPAYLCGASILALARPDNVQAQYGFPTKLGEYLATGNPVVVTCVGEVCRYLQDGHSAYIAQPGSVESFAQKMIEVLSDQKKAVRIGLEGKKVAQEHFSLQGQSIRFGEFIKNLKNNLRDYVSDKCDSKDMA